MTPRIEVDQNRIAEFCRRWKVRELSLFGSVLRDDFTPSSDVDVLVSFEPEAHRTYGEWPDMIDELKSIFGREVDLVEKAEFRNPYRRKAILEGSQVIYAA